MIWLILAVLVFLVFCAYCSDDGNRRAVVARSRSVFRDNTMTSTTVSGPRPVNLPGPTAARGVYEMLQRMPAIRLTNSAYGHLIGEKGNGGAAHRLPIYANHTMTSANGQFVLRQQADGNLCLSTYGRNIWCNGAHDKLDETDGTGDNFVTMFDPYTGGLYTVQLYPGANIIKPILTMYEGDRFQGQLPNSWKQLYLSDSGTLQVIEVNGSSSREVARIA